MGCSTITVPEQNEDPGFLASIYYPTTGGERTIPYLRFGQQAAQVFGTRNGLPFFVMSHLTLIDSGFFDDSYLLIEMCVCLLDAPNTQHTAHRSLSWRTASSRSLC